VVDEGEGHSGSAPLCQAPRHPSTHYQVWSWRVRQAEPVLLNVYGAPALIPRNSASLCSLAGRYENPIPPRCLAPIDFLKIPAQVAGPTPIRYTREDWIRMRSSLVFRAPDCQCASCIGPGFDPSIRRHSGIWGAADEAVLNLVRKKNPPKRIEY
jgi:hypothetical protein